MSRAGFTWVKAPMSVFPPALAEHRRRVRRAAFEVARYMTQIITDHARRNAKWTDRTGNARAALHGIAVAGWGERSDQIGSVQPLYMATEEVAENIVVIYLSHGMDYGKWLELCNAGRYAIVMNALEAHYEQVMALLRRTLGR